MQWPRIMHQNTIGSLREETFYIWHKYILNVQVFLVVNNFNIPDWNSLPVARQGVCQPQGCGLFVYNIKHGDI